MKTVEGHKNRFVIITFNKSYRLVSEKFLNHLRVFAKLSDFQCVLNCCSRLVGQFCHDDIYWKTCKVCQKNSSGGLFVGFVNVMKTESVVDISWEESDIPSWYASFPESVVENSPVSQPLTRVLINTFCIDYNQQFVC